MILVQFTQPLAPPHGCRKYDNVSLSWFPVKPGRKVIGIPKSFTEKRGKLLRCFATEIISYELKQENYEFGV